MNGASFASGLAAKSIVDLVPVGYVRSIGQPPITIALDAVRGVETPF